MTVDPQPERDGPIKGLAARAQWRQRLQEKILAAGVAFVPSPSQYELAQAPDDASADADPAPVINPDIWIADDQDFDDRRLAEAAESFMTETGRDDINACVAHPATGMPLPLILEGDTRAAIGAGRADDALAAFGIFVPGDWRARRSRWLNAELRGAQRSLSMHKYAVLRQLLTPGHLSALRSYVRELRHAELMTFGDAQVPKRYRLYDEPVMHGLHRLLTPLVGQVVGSPVDDTYAYLATYVDGADLPAHLDRPQCRWNVSLAIDQTPDLALADTWPIYVQPEDRALPIHLMPGDAVIYSGTDILHGRLPLPDGQTATLCFFHFVDPGFSEAMA